MPGNRRQFLLYVSNDDYPASLEVRKIYQTVPDPVAAEQKFVRIIDESGEDYLYPASLFLPIELTQAAIRAIAT